MCVKIRECNFSLIQSHNADSSFDLHYSEQINVEENNMSKETPDMYFKEYLNINNSTHQNSIYVL